ncbi:restriction endonuclease subunit S [Enterobacter bugandensis]|uniref:restriction endonuclease subunit S n=1 Tax=Enterobacter bugandensis TaxID=881260 RepID=UPI0013D1DF8E|nr:restriction endonuclease subunit S [Enterobacter bugandensis]
MAKYKAYPEYKDSGMEWCTALPLGWKRTNLRWLSCIYAGGTPSKNVIDYWENGTIPWINSGAVNQSYVTEPSTFISKAAFENSSAKWIPKGALVVALAGQGKTKGMVAQLGINTTCNQSMAAIVFYEKNLSRYIYWWLTSNYQNIRNMAGGDLRDGLNLELLGDIQCPQPNDGECIRISAFLDHETAKIDNLIEKQQQLIELLKEKRQAVISHTVTNGLNPDVPMKDSGVEWLGSIPKHWLCTKIKYIAILTPKKSSVNFKINNECTFIPMEKLKRNSLVTDESKLIRDVISGYTYFEDDDLLLAKVTPCFENKNIAVARGLVNSIGFGSTEIYVLRPTEKIRVNYLLYRLQEENFIRAATGAMTGAGGLKRVPSDFLLNYPIAIPPKSEMDAIVDYLNAQEVHYDLMERNAKQAVQLLQERRTALISAAVTGKIDVRDWVAADTQGVEEPQEATA